ncbi:MAG: YkvA family protein [Geobacteraceae bacterium]|nr:YkvA family protein [Geobacteraceae bacterium]
MSADFSVSYDESSFWEKIAGFAKKAGSEVIEKALILFYVLQDSETPLWARTVVVGALGYFISPLDAIPDVIPLAGFTDDLAVLAGACLTVGACINAEHKAKAASKVSEWFD